MKVGAWIHTHDRELTDEIPNAARSGLTTTRSYSIDYALRAAQALRVVGMSLLGGMHVDSAALVKNWRSLCSPERLSELERYHTLGVPLEAICVGNELREGGDEPDKKRFTARLSFGLANVLAEYRRWLAEHQFDTPLTYAMEGIVCDAQGNFFEWLWPLVDACDIVGLNLYPMDGAAWFTYGAFEQSQKLLRDTRARNDRFNLFEYQLRRVLAQLEQVDKPLILTETGFPSAVGYHLEGEKLVVPESDREAYAEAMAEFCDILARVNRDYGGKIRSVYFYEWRDNLYHAKIWNVEQSPIHTAFGLCERDGTPKVEIEGLVKRLNGNLHV